MPKRKIYVASSWKNEQYPQVVERLRAEGHEVFDWRNPRPDYHGFHWSEIDPNWRDWSPDQYASHLNHPIASRGFHSDLNGMKQCDTCVLLLPSGRSAHLEAGWFIGQGRDTFILLTEPQEPELMYRLATGLYTKFEVLLHRLSPEWDSWWAATTKAALAEDVVR